MIVKTGPLVRAISANSVVIWAEVTQPGAITLTAYGEAQADHEHSLTSATTTVGGHHYVALQLVDLAPATWYTYALKAASSQETLPSLTDEPVTQCFRTLALLGDPANPASLDDHSAPTTLRIAYGSCRKAERTLPDAFSSFGYWLQEHQNTRAEHWPHLLLLIGDQVYADEPPTDVVSQRPHMAQGSSSYEDFACLYQYAWTNNWGTRQTLATIPSYMIFDDHEVTNNWNCTPTSRADEIKAGREQLLIDGEVAYWVYQGWGNIDQQQDRQHPLLTIMREAAQSGEDALERLRIRVKEDVYDREPLIWHYQIPSDPPIFVANARTERTALFRSADDIYAPTHIIGEPQMGNLQGWLKQQGERPAIMVSSVPVLLPPAIGAIEYVTGQRLWHKSLQPLHWLGRQLARLQLRLANIGSFDHWPLYPLSWRKLVASLKERKGDTIILSGDVHFSYALQAHITPGKDQDHTVYQFVSTPLQNELSASNKLQIKVQSYINSGSYGGLRHDILPLKTPSSIASVQRNLLYANTIALLTVQSHPYRLMHEYLGIYQDSLHVVGATVMPDGKTSRVRG